MSLKAFLALEVTLFFLHCSTPSAQEAAKASTGEGTESIPAFLASLEEKMDAVSSVQCDFVQEKRIAVFERDIVLRGNLFLEKPDRLAWCVHEPVRYRMVMHGDNVRQWDEDTGRVQEISISRRPSFEGAISHLRKWFSGNYTSLLSDYTVERARETESSLVFTPKESAIAADVIAGVTITFRADERYIDRIAIVERSGDSTLLRFSNVRLDEPVSPEVWEVDSRVR